MKSIQIRLSDEQLSELDSQVKSGRYPNRSEAVRDYLRKAQLWEALERILALGDIEAENEEEIAARLKKVREQVHEQVKPYLED